MKVTANDIAQLLGGRPPREVPPHVARAARAEGGSTVWIVVGLAFGGFGAIFLLLFFPWRLADEVRLQFSHRLAPGVITAHAETSLSINDTKVVEHFFAFTTDGNVRGTGSCFTTGPRWSVGQAVEVRYLPSDPAVACVEGGRMNQAGWGGALVLLFPLFGLGVAAFTLRARWRVSRLLRDGRAVEVDVLAVDATKVRINYQTVYKITVAAPFLTDQRTVTVRRWGKAEVSLLTARALHKQPVYVLCDPRHPQRLIFPEGLIEP